jgi:hypothetical protein
MRVPARMGARLTRLFDVVACTVNDVEEAEGGDGNSDDGDHNMEAAFDVWPVDDALETDVAVDEEAAAETD